MSAETLRESVAAVYKFANEHKKAFTETIELQIALKQYDPQKDKRFSGAIRLPNAPKSKV